MIFKTFLIKIFFNLILKKNIHICEIDEIDDNRKNSYKKYCFT